MAGEERETDPAPATPRARLSDEKRRQVQEQKAKFDRQKFRQKWLPERATHCALCQCRLKERKSPILLYSHEVCRPCQRSLTKRRLIAFALDYSLYCAFLFFTLPWLERAPIARWFGSGAEATASLQTWYTFVGIRVLLLGRDVFRGRSFGKWITGLVTIDERTGAPLPWHRSVLRNLPFLIPLVALLFAVQIEKGHRWGDSWAGARVARTRDLASPVYSLGATEATARVFG